MCVGVEWLLYGDERNKEFPVNDRMVEWLIEHPEVRRDIWDQMDEEEKK